MVTRSQSQHSIRRTQDNDSLGIRAGTFVPRMVKVFNDLDLELKSLPDIRGTEEERFQLLKIKLRHHCQWKALGFPSYWPEDRESALLDRANEIYGLGIESETTDSDDDADT